MDQTKEKFFMCVQENHKNKNAISLSGIQI